MFTFLIIAGVAVVLGLVVVSIYNGLVKKRTMVEEAWSGISVQLKRRHDLIPNLVNTVKGFAAHEQTAIQAVADARAKIDKWCHLFQTFQPLHQQFTARGR